MLERLCLLAIEDLWLIKLFSFQLEQGLLQAHAPPGEGFIGGKFGHQLLDPLLSHLGLADQVFPELRHFIGILREVRGQTCFMADLRGQIDPSCSLIDVQQWLFLHQIDVVAPAKVFSHGHCAFNILLCLSIQLFVLEAVGAWGPFIRHTVDLV